MTFEAMYSRDSLCSGLIPEEHMVAIDRRCNFKNVYAYKLRDGRTVDLCPLMSADEVQRFGASGYRVDRDQRWSLYKIDIGAPHPNAHEPWAFPKPEPEPDGDDDMQRNPEPEPEPEPEPHPEPEPESEPEPEPQPQPEPEPESEPESEPEPEPQPQPTPTPTPSLDTHIAIALPFVDSEVGRFEPGISPIQAGLDDCESRAPRVAPEN
jgi:hypothetical protein